MSEVKQTAFYKYCGLIVSQPDKKESPVHRKNAHPENNAQFSSLIYVFCVHCASYRQRDAFVAHSQNPYYHKNEH